jgi:adenine-specific DNA-methyltransferase
VVAHLKGTRVVCAVDRKCYPWSDEFHLVQKRDIDLDEVVHYLNGPEIRRYMSSVYRDIVPYLTKEMLKRVPVNVSSGALPIQY